MKTFIILVFLNILNLHPLYSRTPNYYNNFIPFAATPPSSLSPKQQPIKILSFKYNIQNNRIWLNWTFDKNQDADRFEIEKSSDGKSFKMAALVFGTDKDDTDNYQFYEKAKLSKTYYRIKILYKNNTAEYSDVITVNPAIK